jgi:hypothetical protein
LTGGPIDWLATAGERAAGDSVRQGPDAAEAVAALIAILSDATRVGC